MLIRPGAVPILLRADRPFVFGRQSDCQLPIPSKRVSRRHAEIVWEGGAPLISDRGSQNGTQVNGRRIAKPHQLSDGDEIEIGPFFCTYRYTEADTLPPSAADLDANTLTRPMVGDAMAGNLEQLSLFELLQTLDFNKKTGTLEVFGSGGEGLLIVHEGAPMFCRCGGEEGLEAAMLLVQIKRGQFSFDPEVADPERNITMSMTALLMEAGRRMDEAEQTESSSGLETGSAEE